MKDFEKTSPSSIALTSLSTTTTTTALTFLKKHGCKKLNDCILQAAEVHFASEVRTVIGGAGVVSGARFVSGARIANGAKKKGI